MLKIGKNNPVTIATIIAVIKRQSFSLLYLNIRQNISPNGQSSLSLSMSFLFYAFIALSYSYNILFYDFSTRSVISPIIFFN
jgi:hypothetical protein